MDGGNDLGDNNEHSEDVIGDNLASDLGQSLTIAENHTGSNENMGASATNETGSYRDVQNHSTNNHIRETRPVSGAFVDRNVLAHGYGSSNGVLQGNNRTNATASRRHGIFGEYGGDMDGYGCPPSYLLGSTRPTMSKLSLLPTDTCRGGLRAGETSYFGPTGGLHENAEQAKTPSFFTSPSDQEIIFENQTLRGRLKKQLEEESYECVICCQTIFANQWIWSCQKCYHMFHLKSRNSYGCITKWATKSFVENVGWRCPTCQNITSEIPSQYKCFCRKMNNPPTKRFPNTPHTCNSTCGKLRGHGCAHPCTEQCHPGPCPECPVTICRSCDCGAETISVRCAKFKQFKCKKPCGKMLNCGIHECDEVCHKGKCSPCEEIVIQTCFCNSDERVLQCTGRVLYYTSYSCGGMCNGTYDCGLHQCEQTCHKRQDDGRCGRCPLSPESQPFCPCGREIISNLLKEKRVLCTDPITTCKNTCNKALDCGTREEPHRCQHLCHFGPCPKCPGNSYIVCSCRAMKKEISCIEYTQYTERNPFFCERRCKKMKSCGNHRCHDTCCTKRNHICVQVCGKMLSCGKHRCTRRCHVGQCPRCLEASFEEQRCLCGHTVREPPIPCGTSPPPCDMPCSRAHPCSHPPNHNCHSGPECPPCTVLTQKYCYGHHELRTNIPCYLNDVSCGRLCDKILPCGVHHCKKFCHPGLCLLDGSVCQQVCTTRRIGEVCDHICGLLCHGTEPCPKSKCKSTLLVTCACQRISAEMACADVERNYQKRFSRKMENAGKNGPTVRILQRNKSVEKYRCLPCDSDCLIAERNKRMAGALSISGIGEMPPFNKFLMNQLQKSYKHVKEVEEALVQLVLTLQKQLNVAAVSHTFRPMPSEMRRIIHDYAGYFGVETISYDDEPQRNVVATAKKGESHIPTVLLSSFVQKKQSGMIYSREQDSSTVRHYQSTQDGMGQLQLMGRLLKRDPAHTDTRDPPDAGTSQNK